jgi:hypothetical protein
VPWTPSSTDRTAVNLHRPGHVDDPGPSRRGQDQDRSLLIGTDPATPLFVIATGRTGDGAPGSAIDASST